MKLKCIRKTGSDGSVSLKLEGEFTVYTVRKLKDLFMKELGSSTRLELDLSGIRKFDSAGYQLLELTGAEAEKLGRTLLFLGKSAEVAKLLTLYGSCI